VGVNAVKSCEGAISFFGLIQEMYTFFSASTYRWAVMLEYLQNNDDEYQNGSKLVLKRLTDTRWSARAVATKALSQSYNCFQKALQFIVKDTNQTQETIYEAKCLLKGLSKKENIIMAILWSEVLDRINVVRKSLQKETIELHTAIDLLKSLLNF